MMAHDMKLRVASFRDSKSMWEAERGRGQVEQGRAGREWVDLWAVWPREGVRDRVQPLIQILTSVPRQS